MANNYIWVSKFELNFFGFDWKVRMINNTKDHLAQEIDPHITTVHIKVEGCVLF